MKSGEDSPGDQTHRQDVGWDMMPNEKPNEFFHRIAAPTSAGDVSDAFDASAVGAECLG